MSKIKRFNFDSLQQIEVPKEWIENALNASPKHKKPLLRPYAPGTAASLIILAAVTVTLLFHSKADTPLAPQSNLPMMTTASANVSATPGTTALNARTTAVSTTLAEKTTVTELAPGGQTAADTVTATGTTADSIDTEPARPNLSQPTTAVLTEQTEATALEPWQPWETQDSPTTADPGEPGVGGLTDPTETRYEQPLWEHNFIIRIPTDSRFYNSSEVYVHIVNQETGEEVYPLRSEQERLAFTANSDGTKTAVYSSAGRVRQFMYYHLYFYDRQGRVCKKSIRIVRDPSAITFVLE